MKRKRKITGKMNRKIDQSENKIRKREELPSLRRN